METQERDDENKLPWCTECDRLRHIVGRLTNDTQAQTEALRIIHEREGH